MNWKSGGRAGRANDGGRGREYAICFYLRSFDIMCSHSIVDVLAKGVDEEMGM